MVVALNPKLKTLVVGCFDQVHWSHPDHDHSARTGLKASVKPFLRAVVYVGWTSLGYIVPLK